VTLFHLIELLHLTEIHRHCSELLEQETFLKGREAKARRKRTFEAVQLSAYLLTANIDGWATFCAKLKIDPDVLLRDMPWYEIVKYAEPTARALAYTPEEAAAWMRCKGKEPVEVITAEKVAASLREFLERRKAWWD
jgi:hypothetical protein